MIKCTDAMKLIKNTGSDRVVDVLRNCLVAGSRIDIASPGFSLFAFAEIKDLLEKLGDCRIILPSADRDSVTLLGHDSDRPFRNQLKARYLAKECSAWIRNNCEVRQAPAFLPQSTIIASHADVSQQRVITGSCSFTTDGLGLTPGNQFSLIQCSESAEECGSAFELAWRIRPKLSGICKQILG